MDNFFSSNVGSDICKAGISWTYCAPVGVVMLLFAVGIVAFMFAIILLKVALMEWPTMIRDWWFAPIIKAKAKK